MSDDEAESEPRNRTDLAEDRTLLANERTYAGWLRTGLAAVGIGVGFHALFQRMEPEWIPKSIATLFLLMGVAVVVAAEWRARRVLDRLSAHQVTPPRTLNLTLITIATTIGAVGLIAAIWLLRIC
jgi:putative membrane protein